MTRTKGTGLGLFGPFKVDSFTMSLTKYGLPNQSDSRLFQQRAFFRTSFSLPRLGYEAFRFNSAHCTLCAESNAQGRTARVEILAAALFTPLSVGH